MVGLDVTRKIVLTPDLLEYMNRLDSYHGEFVRKITKFYYDFHWEWEHLIGCVINDPLAVAYFANRSLCSGFESYVDVETGGISMGQTVVDAMNFYRKMPNAVVLTQVDSREFFYFFFGKILGKTREELDLLEVLCQK
jgi:purine nucleosidase